MNAEQVEATLRQEWWMTLREGDPGGTSRVAAHYLTPTAVRHEAALRDLAPSRSVRWGRVA